MGGGLRYHLPDCVGDNPTPRRIVREDGHALEVRVSGFSSRGCSVHCELMPGELVSVEAVDRSLLLGEVGGTMNGQSTVTFFGAVSH